VGVDGYSVWEIGSQLPFSETDVSAALGYFKHIVWYSATSGIETYDDAANPINAFLQRGGNIFINVTELHRDGPAWFPYDAVAEVNWDGGMATGTIIESTLNTDLNLQLSRGMPHRARSFALNDTSLLDPDLGPTFTPLYRMSEPDSIRGDWWEGQPIVAAEYDHHTNINANAGKAILFSLPLHEGTALFGDFNFGAFMEGNGSAGKFISWVLQQRFMP
jgi:hypothetical protein